MTNRPGLSTDKLLLLLLLAVGFLLAGCPDDDDDDSSAIDDDDATVDDDDATVDDDDATADDDDDATGPLGSLSGVVTRTVAPVEDGVGSLVVMVINADPFGGDDFQVFGQVIVEDADFSADGASVAYDIPQVFVAPDPFFVLAFLDDNDNVEAFDPIPDDADLVNYGPGGLPTVVIDAEGTFELDLVLESAFEK